MAEIKSSLDTSSKDFVANTEYMQGLVGSLR